jgi:sRNA-binding protein
MLEKFYLTTNYGGITTAKFPFSEEKLKAALKYYAESDGYLFLCVENAPRINLDGNPVGDVTAK